MAANPLLAVEDQPGHQYQNTGTITLPGEGGSHSYQFVTGGGGRGAAPLGTYNVSDFAQGGSLGDRWTLTQQGQPYDTAYDPNINAQRSALRIHMAHGQGTLGCIGILGGAPVYADFENDLLHVMHANGGQTTLNLSSPGAQAVANNMAPPPPSIAGQPPGAPGTTLSQSNPFINALGNAESNWRNIYSGVDKDYAGQPNSRSQGYLQIDTPTWQQFAPKVGVTAPNAMSASIDDQIKVASLLPLSRFGSRTQDLLHKQFGSFDNSQTVGQLAGNYGTSLTSQGGPGGIMDPSINAHAAAMGIPVPGATAPGAPSATAVAGGGAPTDLDKPPQQQQQQAGQGGGGAPAAGSAPQLAPDTSQMRQQQIAAQSQQMMAMLMQQGQKPLSWGSSPYGASAGQQRLQSPTLAAGQLGTQPPGTTLNGGPYG